MLVFLVVLRILSFLYRNVLFLPIILSIFWLFFITHSDFFINSTLLVSGYNDELCLYIVIMSVFVIIISYVFSLYLKENFILNINFVFIFLFCYLVFSTNNLFLLYFSYEASLLPILYIIIKWGSYPERSLRAIMLLIYTSVFTFPFIVVIFEFYFLNFSFCLYPSFHFSGKELSSLFTLIVFFTFAVKLPIYGLHFWLPMAHVEAPTFGSIILAGVLLKLGGLGLIRCSFFIDLLFLFNNFLSYLMVFIVYVTFVCLFQSDFKRLVAYSSVSHMITVPVLLLSNNLMSLKSIVMIMFFHGLSSPLLFILVGIIYSMYFSRQLIAVRGLFLLSPLLSFLIIMAFFFTLSAPPFTSFVSEFYFMVSSFYITFDLVYIFILFTFFSLVYNLNWLSSILFSTRTPSNISFNLTYLSFMPIFISLLFSFIILFLIILVL